MKKGRFFILLLVVSVMVMYTNPAYALAFTGSGIQAEDADSGMSGDIVEISDSDQLNAVITELNTNGGSKTILLTTDVSLPTNGRIILTKGALTVLGGGHTLTAAFSLQGDAVVNLGNSGYDGQLTLLSSRSDSGVFDVAGSSVLNIYDGTTIGPCSRIGTAGAVQAHQLTTVNMYGGTITGCSSASVAGGVYLDGNAVFNLMGGRIENCTGTQGGAVGLSGGSPLGGSAVSSVVFNMFGGTIENCVDQYIGGGAVCAWTAYPVVFNMSGGEIKNCSSTNYGYGGGICIYTTSDTTFVMNGGTISGCSSTAGNYGYGGALLILSRHSNTDIQLNSGKIIGNSANYGGGIMIFSGNLSVADGFGLYNNSANYGGDDIYNNGANVTLGAADTSAVLQGCGHNIDGWYEDAETRWSYEDCTGVEDHLELFTHTGEPYSEEYGLKAAHGLLTYTVNWVNDDGTILETDNDVPLGDMPAYDGETPSKAADEQYTYTFAGWSPEISEVTEDVTYTAVYTETINKYTVTWVDSDGTVLETDTDVPYGTMPAYDGITPSKPSDEQYEYTFNGWSPEIVEVTGDATYKAVYDENLLPTRSPIPEDEIEERRMVIDSIPADEGVETVDVVPIDYGTPVIMRRMVIIPEDETEEITNTYTVTWVDHDGSVLAVHTEIPHGTMPSYDGALPIKLSDAEYTYTFSGWDKTLSEVNDDAVYTAVYSATRNSYMVTWLNEDGTVLETDAKVPYGTMPNYDGATPAKASDGEFIYTFVGWSPLVSEVNGDVSYTAVYSKTASVTPSSVVAETGEDGTSVMNMWIGIAFVGVGTALIISVRRKELRSDK